MRRWGYPRQNDKEHRIQVQMEARLTWDQEAAFIWRLLRNGQFDSEVSDFSENTTW